MVEQSGWRAARAQFSFMIKKVGLEVSPKEHERLGDRYAQARCGGEFGQYSDQKVLAEVLRSVDDRDNLQMVLAYWEKTVTDF